MSAAFRSLWPRISACGTSAFSTLPARIVTCCRIICCRSWRTCHGSAYGRGKRGASRPESKPSEGGSRHRPNRCRARAICRLPRRSRCAARLRRRDLHRGASVYRKLAVGRCADLYSHWQELPVTATEVSVQFRRPPRETFGELVPGGSAHMRFRLGPDMAIGMGLRVKQPGDRMAGDDMELMLTAQAASIGRPTSGCSATRCMATVTCSDVRTSSTHNGALCSPFSIM